MHHLLNTHRHTQNKQYTYWLYYHLTYTFHSSCFIKECSCLQLSTIFLKHRIISLLQHLIGGLIWPDWLVRKACAVLLTNGWALFCETGKQCSSRQSCCILLLLPSIYSSMTYLTWAATARFYGSYDDLLLYFRSGIWFRLFGCCNNCQAAGKVCELWAMVAAT